MSRKFMVLMLVLFGGLLYLTSYALQKQTEPPPPPTAEEQAKMKKMQDDEMRARMESEKAQRRELEKIVKAQAKKQGRSTVESLPVNLPLPPKKEPPKALGPNDTHITNNWMKERLPGEVGIQKEIEMREKNAVPAPTPKLAPVKDGTAPPPADGHAHP